jgi:hypothetical protein
MSPALIDVLLRPDEFFGKVVMEKVSLKVPALIVLIGAVVGAVSAYYISNPTARMMDGISPGLGAFTTVTALVVGFIGTFVFWSLLAEVFFIASMILQKELIPGLNREFIGTTLGLSGIFLLIILPLVQKQSATTFDTLSILLSILSLLALIAIIVSIFIFLSIERFNRPLEFVGYGYLPQILGSLITVVTAIIYVPSVTVPTLTQAALEDPAMIQQVTKALMHDPAMMILTQITTLISIVFMLWSAHIWIFGMKHARNLSPRDAAISVGVPVVLYVLYLTYNLGVM